MLKVLIVLIVFWGLLSSMNFSYGEEYKLLKELRHAVYVLMFCIALYYLLACKVVTSEQLIWYLFLLGLIYTFISAFYFYGWEGHALWDRLKPMLRIDSPIYVSNILVIFGVCVVDRSFSEKKWLLGALLLGCILLCLYFYNSRASIVALIGVFFFILIWRSKTYGRGQLYWLAGVLISYVALLYFFGGLMNRGVSYRTVIWLSALEKLSDCGVFMGCGWSGGSTVEIPSGLLFNHPHNLYIQHLMNTGLFGIISMVGLMFYLIREGIRKNSMITIGLVTSFIAMVFDGGDLITSPDAIWLIFWLPVVLVSWDIDNIYEPNLQYRSKA